MGHRDRIFDKNTITLILLWSIPIILLVIFCKEARFEVENFQGDGQELAAMFILITPILISVVVTIGILVFSIYHLILKKRKGMNTLKAMKPMIIFLITVLICMLIDGKAIILFFTEFSFPFLPFPN